MTIPPNGAGTVTLLSAEHRYTTSYDADGRFSVDVAPGNYRLRAAAFDGMACLGKVTVAAGRQVRASAVCPIP